MTRRYFGQAGHFIAADRCRFHLHTHVAGFCVSTVGEYVPWQPDFRAEEMEPIGLGRLYETMVFELGENDAPSSWSEVDFEAYDDRDAANEGHERLVRKYEQGGAQ